MGFKMKISFDNLNITKTLTELSEILNSPLKTSVLNSIDILCQNIHIKSNCCSINEYQTTIRMISINNSIRNLLEETHPAIALKSIELFQLEDLFELDSVVSFLKNKLK